MILQKSQFTQHLYLSFSNRLTGLYNELSFLVYDLFHCFGCLFLLLHGLVMIIEQICLQPGNAHVYSQLFQLIGNSHSLNAVPQIGFELCQLFLLNARTHHFPHGFSKFLLQLIKVPMLCQNNGSDIILGNRNGKKLLHLLYEGVVVKLIIIRFCYNRRFCFFNRLVCLFPVVRSRGLFIVVHIFLLLFLPLS